MNRKRSLLIISSEFPPGPGGLGTHAYQMAAQLHKLQWQVAVVTPQDYARECETEQFRREQPFPISRVISCRGAVPGFLSRWKTLTRQVKQSRPSLLVATGRRSVWLGAIASRRFGLCLVAVGHGSEFGEQGSLPMALTRWSFRQCEAVICVSEFTRRFMERTNVAVRRAVVIPNGADDTRFSLLPPNEIAGIRPSLGLDGEHLLLTVGAVTQRKGQEVMIRALPQVLQLHPRTHYVLAGLPIEKPQLERLARQLGVTKHVHFLGCVPNEQLPRLMNAADVFIMTSRTTAEGDCEGFGIAIVEAALCGKPAVVSSGAGPAEAILRGVTGLAVPEGDDRATAAAVCRLLTEAETRQQMGRAARQYALREQTWGRRFLEYDHFLNWLLRSPERVAG